MGYRKNLIGLSVKIRFGVVFVQKTPSLFLPVKNFLQKNFYMTGHPPSRKKHKRIIKFLLIADDSQRMMFRSNFAKMFLAS